jgi:D-beta-D-heptose 7-phosphate kinase/D-beta-D-heptose 1-phosphate adenosyltransferase
MTRIGLATGCFDLFHDGHRFFLSGAKSWCRTLVVAVNDDASVRRLKGEGRPILTLSDRMSDVRSAIDEFDSVISFDGDHHKLIAALNPDVIIRGWDQDTETSGTIPIVHISHLPGISTTLLAHERQA